MGVGDKILGFFGQEDEWQTRYQVFGVDPLRVKRRWPTASIGPASGVRVTVA